MQAPSVSFACSHLLSLFSVGRITGLVLDCGHLESVALPVGSDMISSSSPATLMCERYLRLGRYIPSYELLPWLALDYRLTCVHSSCYLGHTCLLPHH
jgi:hypothetical protein